MKIWTFAEMSTKVLGDQDLQDETFILLPELVGYFNEAIEEAQAEINTLPMCDYFKTSTPLRVVSGQKRYPLPWDIFATKIRRLIYTNGPLIYSVSRIKPRDEFEDIEYTEQYGSADDYRYDLTNDDADAARLYLVPKARETAIARPRFAYPDSVNPEYGGTYPSYFEPFRMWYLRTARRLPIPTFNNVQGERRFTESLVCTLTGSSFSSVSVLANTISTVCGLTHNDGYTAYVGGGIPYITGDILYFTPEPGGVLPAPLVQGTAYYVIATATPGVIKLATTLALATAGTALVLTTTGTGFVDVQVVTTPTILNSMLVDIPLAATFIMQWVKCRTLDKETDPRLSTGAGILEGQRKIMVETLSEMVPDLDSEIQPDLSHYQEMT